MYNSQVQECYPLREPLAALDVPGTDTLAPHYVPCRDLAPYRAALWLWLASRAVPNARAHLSSYDDICGAEHGGGPTSVAISHCRLRSEILKDLKRTPAKLFVRATPAGDRLELAQAPGAVMGDISAAAASMRRAAERVLVAYGHFHGNVGYCQGLNFVVVVLLSVLDEESTFVVLSGLVASLAPDLYSCDPDRLATCRVAMQERVWRALTAERPRLGAHLHDLELDLNLFLPRWLTTLFSAVLDVPATLRLWDHVLSGASGDDTLVRMALALITRAETDLVQCDDLTEVLSELAAIAAQATPADIDNMLLHEWPPSRLWRAEGKVDTVPRSARRPHWVRRRPSRFGLLLIAILVPLLPPQSKTAPPRLVNKANRRLTWRNGLELRLPACPCSKATLPRPLGPWWPPHRKPPASPTGEGLSGEPPVGPEPPPGDGPWHGPGPGEGPAPGGLGVEDAFDEPLLEPQPPPGQGLGSGLGSDDVPSQVVPRVEDAFGEPPCEPEQPPGQSPRCCPGSGEVPTQVGPNVVDAIREPSLGPDPPLGNGPVSGESLAPSGLGMKEIPETRSAAKAAEGGFKDASHRDEADVESADINTWSLEQLRAEARNLGLSPALGGKARRTKKDLIADILRNRRNSGKWFRPRGVGGQPGGGKLPRPPGAGPR